MTAKKKAKPAHVTLSKNDLRRTVKFETLLRRLPNSLAQFVVVSKRASKTSFHYCYSWDDLVMQVDLARKVNKQITIYPMAAYKPTVIDF